MKSILKYSLVLGVVASVSSCKKNLELAPIYENTNLSAFKKLDDFANGLNAVYTRFADVSYYNGNHGCLADAPTDNFYETIESLVNFQRLANWTYLPNELYMSNCWTVPYNGIYQANLLLSRLDAFAAENTGKYNRILGQLLAARALMHFDLLKMYSNNLDRNSTDLGIPIKVNTDITSPSRNTVKEVYDFIYNDLGRAIVLLGTTDIAVNSASNKGFIDQLGARCILARVAITAKDYATAISNASPVIAAVPLASRTVFPGIWNDASVSEVVWSIQNNNGDPGSPFPSADVMSFRFNRNTFGLHTSLFNLYDTTGYAATGTSRDVRFSSYFFIRNATLGINNWALQKFRGKGAASDNLVNFKVFRVAEMYLIRAEAYANTPGQDNLGSADLNALKAVRINAWSNVAYSGAGLKTEIENERRRELVGEGHRWFDLKRGSRVVSRPVAGLGNPNAMIATSLPASSNKWVFPIPEFETRVNPNMTQNPGYN
jgi:starch-binding outer membrane protein, SusD/RagB family